jgi:hypothetical protein
MRFHPPFALLREKGGKVTSEMVASLVMYYFVAGGSLPFFEERQRYFGSVSMASFEIACDLHAYALDAIEAGISSSDDGDDGQNGTVAQKRLKEHSTDEEDREYYKRHRKDASSVANLPPAHDYELLTK